MGYRVLIAEASEVIRVGLCAIFVKDTCVSEVVELDTEKNLLEQLEQRGSSFHLIIVNQLLIKELLPLRNTNFVVLTAKPDLPTLKAAFEHGARGYLSVNVSVDLLRTLLRPSKQSFLIEPTFVPEMMQRMFVDPYFNVDERLLTRREREIMILLREGYSRTGVAKRLSITETTLKTHIKNIAKKRNQAL